MKLLKSSACVRADDGGNVKPHTALGEDRMDVSSDRSSILLTSIKQGAALPLSKKGAFNHCEVDESFFLVIHVTARNHYNKEILFPLSQELI